MRTFLGRGEASANCCISFMPYNSLLFFSNFIHQRTQLSAVISLRNTNSEQVSEKLGDAGDTERQI